MNLRRITGIIVAGGKGTRMRRLADYLPKAFLPIYDEPLIQKQLQILVKNGVQKVVISFYPQYCDLLKKRIIKPLNLQCNIFVEPDKRQIGVAAELFRIIKKYDIKESLVILGDIYCKDKNDYLCGLNKFRDLPKYSCNVILQVQGMTRKDICQGCNVLFVRGKGIRYVKEKPLPVEIQSSWAWTGIAYLKNIIKYFKNKKNFDNLRYIGDIFSFLLQKNVLIQYSKCNNVVMNLNTPIDLLKASLIEKNTVMKIRNKKRS